MLDYLDAPIAALAPGGLRKSLNARVEETAHILAPDFGDVAVRVRDADASLVGPR